MIDTAVEFEPSSSPSGSPNSSILFVQTSHLSLGLEPLSLNAGVNWNSWGLSLSWEPQAPP